MCTDDKTGMAIRPVEGVPMEKIDNILQEIVGYNAENGGYPPTQNGDIRSLFLLLSLPQAPPY